MTKSYAAIIACAAILWSSAASANQCNGGSFDGLYAGGSVGYANLDSHQLPNGSPKQSDDGSGVIVGGHLGYNMQCGTVVLGVEGDVSYADASNRSVESGQTSYRSDIDLFGSLRGRLGIAVSEHALVYATAGAAWAKINHTLHDPAAPFGNFFQSDDDTATGWVIGGGLEFLRHERWLLRAEVLWADLGSQNTTYTQTGGCAVNCTTRVKWDDELIVARVGLSIKFGDRPRHEPLK